MKFEEPSVSSLNEGGALTGLSRRDAIPWHDGEG